MPPHSASQSATASLPRVIGPAQAIAIVIGVVIGSGIFLVPREIMAAVGDARTVGAVWITGGVLTLFGAMCYAELAAMRPHVGGDYVFLHDAYGPRMAYIYAWTMLLIASPGSVASVALGLVRTLGLYPPFAFLDHTAFAGLAWNQLFAIAMTWVVVGINILGTHESAVLQTTLTTLKVTIIVVIAGICFLGLKHGGMAHLASHYVGARGGFGGFMIALTAALWAYDGWADVAFIAGEVKQPQRSLPIALIGGVTVVGLLYLLTNLALQYVLPAATIATSLRPTTDAMQTVGGSWAANLVTLCMMISIVATFLGSSLTNARVPFAASRDGLLPSPIAAVHPRFRTPWVSLLLQGVIATTLLLAIGHFQELFSLTIFSVWIFYMIAVSTVFVFRRSEPTAERPYRVSGYPIVPALFILAAAVLVIFTIMDQPRNSLIGLGLIALSLPAYELTRRSRTSRGHRA
jgi:APA family basic amino acid/polyamine antiporter